LRQWTDQGKIESIRTSATNGKRLYNIHSLQQHLGVQSHQADTEKKSFVYARVSSSHQKEDLQRQIQDLSAAYPTHQVVQDIGSGLNFKRKGLQTLLDQVLKGMVKTIVVAYKDRLCRYGIELLELIFKRFGTQLVVYSKTDTIRSETTADDLLAIANIFVARQKSARKQKKT
jgi:predicted site-specific integrase-resolvase